jgi:threonyl-tRNA synthetase
MKLPYVAAKGEAAFYGPKVDFLVRDVLGRKWQLGTVQLDYVLPERFGLEYTGSDGQKHRPVMIHRAPFGSMERFTGILIEHFGGAFPLWLAPVQVGPVHQRKIQRLRRRSGAGDHGSRPARRAGPQRGQNRRQDRLATLQKVPYMLIVGEKERWRKLVAVRTRAGADQGQMLAGGVHRTLPAGDRHRGAHSGRKVKTADLTLKIASDCR